MRIEIKKIVVLLCDYGPDKVQLHTELKPCMWPFDESPYAAFEVARDTGAAYVNEQFGIDAEVINIRSEKSDR